METLGGAESLEDFLFLLDGEALVGLTGLVHCHFHHLPEDKMFFKSMLILLRN